MTASFVAPKDGRRRHYAFSGGRSSAYLLWRTVEANGGLPEGASCVFTNTGKERDETLDFVSRCAEELNVPIVWLEYDHRPHARGGRDDPKHTFRQVDYTTASRNGEPFEQLIRSKGYVPSPMRRFCTRTLKVETAERYLRSRGWDLSKTRYRSVLGIRYDEPRRWRKALYEECATEYPLVDARVTRTDVLDFWRRAPFDLALPHDSGWSNCDLCFLKGQRKVRALAELEPDRLAWWIRAEEAAPGHQTGKNGGFDRLWRYADILTGQIGLDLDRPETSCYCGD